MHCLKRHSQLWDCADLDTGLLTLKLRGSPQPEIKANLEFHFNPRTVLLDFHSFTENAFAYHAYNVVFIIFGYK